MFRKFRIDILSIVLLVVLPGLPIWFRGSDWFGIHSPERRAGWIVGLCVAFVVLFVWFSYDASSRPAIAARRIRYWVARQFNSRSLVGTASKAEHPRAEVLRERLRERHGWRWRYRDRWVVVAGDEPLVKRIAPGLIETGYAITGDTVLLYAKQTTDEFESEWLDRIRRLRRRRPVDAIVAVTRNRSSANGPFDAEGTAQRLARHARALRWAAPAYLLNVTDFGSEQSGPDEVIGFTWSNERIRPDEIDASLRDLEDSLSGAGVVRLTQDPDDRYPAELSRHIAALRNALSNLVMQTGQSRLWRNAVHGLLFAPLFEEREPVVLAPTRNAEDGEPQPPQQRTIWQTVGDHSRQIHGRRVGFSLSSTAAWVTTALIGCWIAGTMLSGFTNRSTIQTAGSTIAQLSTEQDRTQAMLALDSLDKQIDTLEVHQRDGAPWLTRFGLNRDAALLVSAWPGYESAVNRIIVAPIRVKLEERLQQLDSLPDAEIASGGNAQVQAAYDTLKAYLMLARPDRALAAFLTPQLIATAEPVRPASSPLTSGTWEDLRPHAIAFFASHLGRRGSAVDSPLAIVPDAALVATARQAIIGVRGIQNSTDAIYQQIIDDAKPKYPPVPLTALLGDTSSRGLFNTTATVPGVFTRTAWDERIAKAIDNASEQRNVTNDWVLSDVRASAPSTGLLKAELRQRYFDDYARAWSLFLNSFRWQPAPTLSGTVDQLTLLSDPQRSPMVALMNAVVYQAGAGAVTQSLSGTLISTARQIVGADEKDPSKQAHRQLAPLATAFGPILRLTGSELATGALANEKVTTQLSVTGDLSLARYLERMSAIRLKVQQMVNSPDADAIARSAAQSVLQGKTSDIADSRDYASRLAASLGGQWAGFGDLFQAPLDQTWQVVVQPAAASLNEIWRTAIVADWSRTFGGRYPFADSDNDASLPEMARFMRLENGVITRFVTTQLAGIVERQGDRWVAAQQADHGAGHGALTLDPDFLPNLNRLARVATVLFPTGDAHVRYELRAVPTAGVIDMKFMLSGRELHYFNQKEEWTPFVWPGDPLENLAHIEWQTGQGGLRSALDAPGRFGLIRLLEHAKVSPQDSARYLLTWTPDQSQGIALRVQLRSEAGAGPLDVLELRHFTLPTRIFVTGMPKSTAKGGPKLSAISPPPLPS